MAGHERLSLVVRNTAGALLLTLAGIYLSKLLFPFLVGLVAAVMLDPAVSGAERRGLPRGLTAVVLLLAFTVATVAVVTFGVGRLAAEVGSLVESGWGEAGLKALEKYTGGLENLLRGEPARQGLGAVAGWTMGVARAVPGVTVAVVISFFAAYLLLRDKHRLLAAAAHLIPGSFREKGVGAGREVGRSLGGIIRAELILSLTTGAMAVGGFSLVGVRYAWLLGLGAGLLDLLPMVGSSAIFLPVAVYLAVTGAGGKALGVLAAAGAAMLVRQVWEPRLLAAGTGLHPLTMLVAVYAGFRVFGPFGLVVGPLAAACFTALFRVAVEPLLDER